MKKVNYLDKFLLKVFILFVFFGSLYANDHPYIIVLGTAQDGGSPHAACKKDCCEELWDNRFLHKKVSSIAIVNPKDKKFWIIDATPDFPEQLDFLEKKTGFSLAGIFITHAHMGHYTGLLHLGREVMGSKNVPVFVMKKMKKFIESNGPWSQLVELKNIDLKELSNEQFISLSTNLFIKPILVPHRDEFSETVGYQIKSKKSLIFIPDIDKWSKWSYDIRDVVQKNDYNLLDGTFYNINELPGRDMSKIPHPFIVETMELIEKDKNKVFFIHLNHTNPALKQNSLEHKNILKKGFNITKFGQKFHL
tara:strand:- start:169 stop:1089 length:921 start_codon:yes stop_codon:yes gene_type:complete